VTFALSFRPFFCPALAVAGSVMVIAETPPPMIEQLVPRHALVMSQLLPFR
jgi:hypothetical protein